MPGGLEQVANGDLDTDLGDAGSSGGADGVVPDEWPDVPLLDDGVVGNSLVRPLEGDTNVQFDLTTDADATSTFNEMVAAYESAGCTTTTTTTTTTNDFFAGSDFFSTYEGERNGIDVKMRVTWSEGSPTAALFEVTFRDS